MKGHESHPVDRATGHPRPESVSFCSGIQCQEANSRRKSKTEATTPTPKPSPALTRRSAAYTVSMHFWGSLKIARREVGVGGRAHNEQHEVKRMREETSTYTVVELRCHQLRLQRLQCGLHTFFEIMSSLATDLEAVAEDMADDGCKDARNCLLS